ncbi:MoaD/ThiS family protein [Silicimonas sp. MF1-12-2]|jgi:molybdopterin converting factor small subunit|uniref:MoaD/ThiS family protein n=1 Tax=Silicimonas sp. MF1-12-2 TaxID=3384793 RepID=UPI0039B40C75
MVRVKLWGSLRSLAGDREVLEVEARTLKEAIDAILEEVPALEPQIKRGISFSVDGLIYRDSWFVPIDEAKEIVMMPRMVGG